MDVLAPSMPLLEKLQLKDEKNLLIQGLPSTVEKQFSKLSFAKNITPLLRVRKIDFALVFAVTQKQLKDILREVLPALNTNAKLWIAYPKLTSKIVSDLSRDCNWTCAAQFGLVPVRLIAVDHVWSAMKFKKDDLQKLIPDPTAEVEGDKEKRTLTAPIELEKLFKLNKKAFDFFESLSYSNKKEYLVWITGAKREETRQTRIAATIEKLSLCKKNPAEK
jgi:hypothetical protein